ncbi:hypothetical protein DB347_24445 [Opitutaceae bacterium EW11]|nr:hypothetical protein DB347_24445 [Opitutaceae bacterium EW11]
MRINFAWLLGRKLEDAARQDFTWWFVFPDGSSITTDAFWRLVTPLGIEASASDEGQTFGLSAPFDSIARVLEATGERKIIDVHLAERTSDLVLVFEGGVRIDFLNLSSGYESWRAKHGLQEIICMGGGRLSVRSNEKQG